MQAKAEALRPLRVGEHRCIYCARVGMRGFLNKYGDYDQDYGYYCENHRACERRARKLYGEYPPVDLWGKRG